MIVIKETPIYITRELCFRAGIEYDETKICYAALLERDICGFCVFVMQSDTAVITYVEAPNAEILDGVVRAAIAGGEQKGARFYDFDVSEELSEKLLPLGFRKSQGTSPHSIEKLFTACSGCSK